MQLLIPFRFDLILIVFGSLQYVRRLGYVSLLKICLNVEARKKLSQATSRECQNIRPLSGDWRYLFVLLADIFLLNHFDVQGKNILKCL